MNILMIGRNDPAGTMIAFANAINRYTDHTARVVALETRYSMDYEYDIELPRVADEDYGEIEDLLNRSDIFHFHMLMDERCMVGPLLIRDFIGGKKILHHHHGHPDFLHNGEAYTDKYRKLGRRAVVSTPDLLKLMPDATWQPNLVPLFDSDFLPREDHLAKQDRIKVVQAPTRKWHKHTAEFLRASSQIQTTHPNVEVHILEKMSYVDCLKFKRSCHMCFDHMNGWFGISSLESLSQGVPTLAGLDEWNIAQIKDFTGAEKLPWVVARTEEQLYREMLGLVQSAESRVEIGGTSRDFMEHYWTEQHVLKLLVDTYEGL